MAEEGRGSQSVSTAGTSKWKTWRKRAIWALLLGFLLALLFVAYTNLAAVWAARGKVFGDVSDVPKSRVGLVFGTSAEVSGRENLYFRYRIDAATKLWKAKKVDLLLVSGDNRSKYYNEPEKMREALIENGIPSDRIVSDYAGLRTLDSVVRAKEIFGAEQPIFISQRFQVERALYLTKAYNIKAYGYAARDVESSAGLKTRIREVGARVKMWLDVHFLNTRPQFLGNPESLPN